jgi:hypothetical protein
MFTAETPTCQRLSSALLRVSSPPAGSRQNNDDARPSNREREGFYGSFCSQRYHGCSVVLWLM